MPTTVSTIDEVVEKLNGMSYDERRKVFEQLKEPQQPLTAKSTGKKGYVSPDTIWIRDDSYRYRGQYVAIKNGEFIASGRTIKDADQAAKAKGVTNPLLHYVLAEGEEAFCGW